MGDYGNETWRASHGYKEAHIPDPPARRNRDFKPIRYGAFVGIPLYKDPEPFNLLKHLKDIPHEHHNELVRYPMMAAKGALFGALYGYLFFLGAPTGAFELEKLMAATGSRNFSGRALRFARHTLTKPAALGASVFVAYNYIIDWRRGHKEAHMRPRIYDHSFALCTIATLGSTMYATHPIYVAMTFLTTLLILSPMTWFMYLKRREFG